MKDDRDIKDRIDNLAELFFKYIRSDAKTLPLKQKGFWVLFSGESGTGKTMAANMLEEVTGKKLIRIDLSRLISKYIGETEKNLSDFFDKAQSSDWILFFDEADALFGKKSNVKDSNKKRYANQEISYLLKFLDNYRGITIISTRTLTIIESKTKRRFKAIFDFKV
jgi:SpoVK/Ycf46/Vps4 family AAA+-type ATPase